MKSVTSPDGHVDSYYYDPTTNEAWVVTNGIAGAIGTTVTQTVHTKTTVANGVTTTLVENSLTGASTTTTVSYDGTNRIVTTTDQVNLGVGNVPAVNGFSVNGLKSVKTTQVFDADGNLLRDEQPGLAPVVYTYNRLGNLLTKSVKDGNGGNWEYLTNADGQVLLQTETRKNPLGLTSMIESTGEFDAFGRVTKVTDALGGVTTYQYLSGGSVVQQTDQNGMVTSTLTDAMGRVRYQTDAAGGQTYSTYDLSGNMVKQQMLSAAGAGPAVHRQTMFVYDELNRQVGTVGYSLNGNGYLVATTSTSASYTVGGGQTQVSSVDGDGNTTLTTYDSAGHVIQVVQPTPQGSTRAPMTSYGYAYDSGQKTVTVTTDAPPANSPIDYVTTSLVNTAGWTLKTTNGNGAITQTTDYDQAGRAIWVANLATSTYTKYQYDTATGLVSSIQVGTVASGMPPNTPATTMAYDSAGNQVSLTDPNQNTTLRSYDALGRITTESTLINSPQTPNQTQWATRRWAYNGNTTTYTDRNGAITVTTVDPTKYQQTERWFSAGSDPGTVAPTDTLVYQYNSAGEMVSAADYGTTDPTATGATPTSLVTYQMNDQGQVQSETEQSMLFGVTTPTTTVTSGYDPAGSQTSQNVYLTPTGQSQQLLSSTTYSIDALGHVTGIQQAINTNAGGLWKNGIPGKGKSVSIGYYTNGQRQSLTRYGKPTIDPTDVEGYSVYTYSQNDQLYELMHGRNAGGAMIAQYTNLYSPAGQMNYQSTSFYSSGSSPTTLYSQSQNFNFGFDGQLTGVTTTGGSTSTSQLYAYDSGQNQKGPLSSVGKDNRLLMDGLGSTYTYDAEGRVVSFSYTAADAGETSVRFVTTNVSFTWDQRGRLTQMVEQGPDGPATTTQYAYDALNRLIGTQTSTGSTVTKAMALIYSGSSQIAELDLNDGGKVIQNDLRGPDGQELLAVDQTTSALPVTVWMFADPNGSVQTLGTVDVQGNWQLKDQLFSATGTVGATFGDSTTALNLAPVVWNGSQNYYSFLPSINNLALLGNLYQVSGQWYVSGLGRSLSQSGPVTASDTNPYIINGNDPFAKSNAGVNWDALAGDNPGGLTWVDHTIRGVQGLTNVLNFGFSDWYTRQRLGNDVAGVYQRGAAYWVGTGIGMVATIAIGNGAACSYSAFRAGSLGVRAATIYTLTGDVVGVAQSSYNLATNQFSAMDTLGFLPTIGWLKARYTGANCFAAGTPLLTPDGSKPIEQFVAGDLILSRDEHDPEGPLVARRVERVFQRYGQTAELQVGGRTITTTAEHPFYVSGQGWTPTADLKAGDQLLTHENVPVAVDRVTLTTSSSAVYNLRVAEDHTYFVGRSEWGFNVWAHNQYFQKVAYGSDALTAVALDARQSGRLLRRQNGVVAEFYDEAGSLQSKLFKNVQGDSSRGRATLHAEEVMDAFFQKKRISPDQVSRIYSEYYPCTSQSCRQLLSTTYSKSQVLWSFPYDRPGGFWTTIGRRIRSSLFNRLGL